MIEADDLAIKAMAEFENPRLRVVAIRANVEVIRSACFAEHSELKVVQFEGTPRLEGIEGAAFWKCRSLRRLRLPSSLREIADGFERDDQLPQNVCGAFGACSRLALLLLPAGLTNIGDFAFYACGALALVRFPAALRRLGKESFAICLQLASVELPQRVEEIGEEAFWGCCALRTAKVRGADCVGVGAFSTTPIASLELPPALERIPRKMCAGCRRLSELRLPAALKAIGSRAFTSCGALTSIGLPALVEVVGDEAFSWCGGLTSVEFPPGIRSIEKRAFDGCRALTTVDVSRAAFIAADAFLPTCDVRRV